MARASGHLVGRHQKLRATDLNELESELESESKSEFKSIIQSVAVPYQILVSFCIRTTRWLAARRGPERRSWFTSSILFFPSFSRYRPLCADSAESPLESRLTLPADVYWLPCRRVSRENEGKPLANTWMLGFGSSATSDSMSCLLCSPSIWPDDFLTGSAMQSAEFTHNSLFRNRSFGVFRMCG